MLDYHYSLPSFDIFIWERFSRLWRAKFVFFPQTAIHLSPNRPWLHSDILRTDSRQLKRLPEWTKDISSVQTVCGDDSISNLKGIDFSSWFWCIILGIKSRFLGFSFLVWCSGTICELLITLLSRFICSLWPWKACKDSSSLLLWLQFSSWGSSFSSSSICLFKYSYLSIGNLSRIIDAGDFLNRSKEL